MAKKVIGENYTFTPSTRTIVVNGKFIRRETLVLILNVTTNTVIYNFADSNLNATAYTPAVNPTTLAETTTIVLNYNTTSMSATDKLSIIVDEINETIYPSETLLDPVMKLRVSTPQALIDTDFEYGTQPTKWETITLVNNRPSAFFDNASPLTNINQAGTFLNASGNYQITNIAGNGNRVVTISINNTTGITTTTPIYVQDTTFPEANGWWLPNTVTTNSSITYNVFGTIPAQSIYDITKTYVWVGSNFSLSGVAVSATAGVAVTYSGTVITVTTIQPHGFSAGNAVYMQGLTATTNPPNGVWTIRDTPTVNTFRFDAILIPTGTIGVTAPGSGLTLNTTAVNGVITQVVISAAGSAYLQGDLVNITGGGSNAIAKIMAVGASGAVIAVQVFFGGTGYTTASAVATSLNSSCNTLFPRTYGSSIHRPWDGGVNFTAGIPYNGNQTIRQTRRYFRYQSGKGVQFSTGSNFTPPLFVDNLVATGSTVTVNCRIPHSLGPNTTIQVAGAVESAYNGTFTILDTPTLNQIRYVANTAPTATTANGFPVVQARNWYGACVRVGMFDNQNGFYWEYDGQQVYAVQRSSTTQLSGLITTLYAGNCVVNGTNTQFSKQLTPGDYVVIRGMSYIIENILSDTQMIIYPEYRGTNITFPAQVTMSKTTNLRIPQSQFNIDRLDGTGSSGYTLDITRMQMWYIDYTWYGAGAIRWGIKDQRGEVKYAHRLANAGRNTEAYMRSGNLPGRYEVNTNWPFTTITATVGAAETSTINVVSTADFPPSGVLILKASALTGGAIEYIRYTGKTATTFTGLTRAITTLTGPGGLVNLGGNSGTNTFTYSFTQPIQVALFSPQAGITIGHWGSSVIMDGRYDDDKSFVFNYGQNAQQTFASAGVRYPVFSIRLAPAVDQGLTGILGGREIINRMQLTLRNVGVFTTTASVRVELILNGRVTGTPGTWTQVGGSSLAQFATHGTTSAISGGESIFNFFAPSGGLSTQDLSVVRDLGNSILGGGMSFTNTINDNNKYPDGPDQVTLCVTPLAVNAAVAARMNWTEAQA
jgi:hypothetical protein